MCGIVSVKRKEGVPAAKAVFKRFNKQRNRGTRGFGYIAVENGYVTNVVKAETEQEIRESLMKEKASEILFHHRMPTGNQPNHVSLAHPMVIKEDAFDYDYYVVHNGIISNSDQLKKEHERLGFKYRTEFKKVRTEKEKIVFDTEEFDIIDDKVTTTFGHNDSESLALELALYMEGFQETIDIRGAAAFIFYQVEKETNRVVKMVYGCNLGRPLKLEIGGSKKKNGGDIVSVKSEGNGEDIDSNCLYIIHYNKTKREVEQIPFTIGNYSYHTPSKVNTGFHRNVNDYGEPPSPSRNPKPAGERPSDEYIRGMFPYVNDVNDDDEDVKIIYDLEDELVEQLEKQEGEAILRKSEALLEKIIAIESDIAEIQRICAADNDNPAIYSHELHQLNTERTVLIEEFQSVNDLLMQYNLPLPSEYAHVIMNKNK